MKFDHDLGYGTSLGNDSSK